MVRFIPFFVLSEHCVQDSQQLAHTGNQRHFFGFSGCKQTHVKWGRLENGKYPTLRLFFVRFDINTA